MGRRVLVVECFGAGGYLRQQSGNLDALANYAVVG